MDFISYVKYSLFGKMCLQGTLLWTSFLQQCFSNFYVDDFNFLTILSCLLSLVIPPTPILDKCIKVHALNIDYLSES